MEIERRELTGEGWREGGPLSLRYLFSRGIRSGVEIRRTNERRQGRVGLYKEMAVDIVNRGRERERNGEEIPLACP